MTEMKPSAAPSGKFTSHSLNLTDRKKMSLTGVVKVESSNAGEVVMTTALGRLIVTGSELKIDKFDVNDGNLTVAGNIDTIKYATAKQPLLKRIFK